jgi:hypothetical protein
MRALGGIIAALSAVVGLLVLFGYDTSIPNSGGGRVHNLGLMSEKQNFLLVTAAAGIAGVILFALGGRKQNELPTASKDSTTSHESNDSAKAERDFDASWLTLQKYDARFASAVKIVEPHGQAALRELKRVFRVVNDPGQIERIAQQIADEALRTPSAEPIRRAAAAEYDEEKRLMDRHGIVFVDGKFAIEGRRFDTLNQAVGHATQRKA